MHNNFITPEEEISFGKSKSFYYFKTIVPTYYFNFRYENGHFESSFTPAQLQQIRSVSLSQLFCTNALIQDSDDVNFGLSQLHAMLAQSAKNPQVPCSHEALRPIDLRPWVERIDVPETQNLKRPGIFNAHDFGSFDHVPQATHFSRPPAIVHRPIDLPFPNNIPIEFDSRPIFEHRPPQSDQLQPIEFNRPHLFEPSFHVRPQDFDNRPFSTNSRPSFDNSILPFDPQLADPVKKPTNFDKNFPSPFLSTILHDQIENASPASLVKLKPGKIDDKLDALKRPADVSLAISDKLDIPTKHKNRFRQPDHKNQPTFSNFREGANQTSIENDLVNDKIDFRRSEPISYQNTDKNVQTSQTELKDITEVHIKEGLESKTMPTATHKQPTANHDIQERSKDTEILPPTIHPIKRIDTEDYATNNTMTPQYYNSNQTKDNSLHRPDTLRQSGYYDATEYIDETELGTQEQRDFYDITIRVHKPNSPTFDPLRPITVIDEAKPVRKTEGDAKQSVSVYHNQDKTPVTIHHDRRKPTRVTVDSYISVKPTSERPYVDKRRPGYGTTVNITPKPFYGSDEPIYQQPYRPDRYRPTTQKPERVTYLIGYVTPEQHDDDYHDPDSVITHNVNTFMNHNLRPSYTTRRPPGYNDHKPTYTEINYADGYDDYKPSYGSRPSYSTSRPTISRPTFVANKPNYGVDDDLYYDKPLYNKPTHRPTSKPSYTINRPHRPTYTNTRPEYEDDFYDSKPSYGNRPSQTQSDHLSSVPIYVQNKPSYDRPTHITSYYTTSRSSTANHYVQIASSNKPSYDSYDSGIKYRPVYVNNRPTYVTVRPQEDSIVNKRPTYRPSYGGDDIRPVHENDDRIPIYTTGNRPSINYDRPVYQNRPSYSRPTYKPQTDSTKYSVVHSFTIVTNKKPEYYDDLDKKVANKNHATYFKTKPNEHYQKLTDRGDNNYKPKDSSDEIENGQKDNKYEVMSTYTGQNFENYEIGLGDSQTDSQNWKTDDSHTLFYTNDQPTSNLDRRYASTYFEDQTNQEVPSIINSGQTLTERSTNKTDSTKRLNQTNLPTLINTDKYLTNEEHDYELGQPGTTNFGHNQETHETNTDFDAEYRQSSLKEPIFAQTKQTNDMTITDQTSNSGQNLTNRTKPTYDQLPISNIQVNLKSEQAFTAPLGKPDKTSKPGHTLTTSIDNKSTRTDQTDITNYNLTHKITTTNQEQQISTPYGQDTKFVYRSNVLYKIQKPKEVANETVINKDFDPVIVLYRSNVNKEEILAEDEEIEPRNNISGSKKKNQVSFDLLPSESE